MYIGRGSLVSVSCNTAATLLQQQVLQTSFSFIKTSSLTSLTFKVPISSNNPSQNEVLGPYSRDEVWVQNVWVQNDLLTQMTFGVQNAGGIFCFSSAISRAVPVFLEHWSCSISHSLSRSVSRSVSWLSSSISRVQALAGFSTIL